MAPRLWWKGGGLKYSYSMKGHMDPDYTGIAIKDDKLCCRTLDYGGKVEGLNTLDYGLGSSEAPDYGGKVEEA